MPKPAFQYATDHTKAVQYTGGKAVIVTPSGKLKCPHCRRQAEFRYLEDIVCHRPVSGVEKGVLKIGSYYETGEGYDDGTHPRLECRRCFEQCELPERMEVDFI